MSRDAVAGFTLIEALVAMAILAVGAVTMLTAVQTHASRIGALSDRVIARWVAENRLAELRLELSEGAERRSMMGLEWRLRETRSETTDPALDRVDVSVGPVDTDEGLVTLTGYILAPRKQEETDQ